MKLSKDFKKAWSSWWLWLVGILSSLWAILPELIPALEVAIGGFIPFFPSEAGIVLAVVSGIGAVLRAIHQDFEDKKGDQ